MLPCVALLLLLLAPGLDAGAAENKLISLLLEQDQEWSPLLHPDISPNLYIPLAYNPLERPVITSSDSVPLKFGIA